MRGQDLGELGQLVGEAAGGVVLVVDQVVRVLVPEQVGPASRAVQQSPAGEDRHDIRLTGVRCGLQGVGQVGEGVSGSGDGADPHGR